LIADRYNLNKLLDHEIRKEYQIDVGNRFSALEGLEISSVDDTWVISALEGSEISSEDVTWVNIRASIKVSAKEKLGVLETNRYKP
jgi:hypothetical protein